MSDAAPRQDPQAAAPPTTTDSVFDLYDGWFASTIADLRRGVLLSESRPVDEWLEESRAALRTLAERRLVRAAPPAPSPDQLAVLARLPENWDSYGAPRINPTTIQRAYAWLASVNAVPCSDGGVQLEWHSEGGDVEIVFRPDGSAEFHAEALRGGPPLEPSQEARWGAARAAYETYMGEPNWERASPDYRQRWFQVAESVRVALADGLRAVPSQESTCPDCGGTGRKAPDVGIFRTLPCHCPAGLRAVPSQESGPTHGQ